MIKEVIRRTQSLKVFSAVIVAALSANDIVYLLISLRTSVIIFDCAG
jgi:hypothetical protein